VTLIPWFSLTTLYEDNTRIGMGFGALGLENDIGFLDISDPKSVFFLFFCPNSRFSKKEGSVYTYPERSKNDPPLGTPLGHSSLVIPGVWPLLGGQKTTPLKEPPWDQKVTISGNS